MVPQTHVITDTQPGKMQPLHWHGNDFQHGMLPLFLFPIHLILAAAADRACPAVLTYAVLVDALALALALLLFTSEGSSEGFQAWLGS